MRKVEFRITGHDLPGDMTGAQGLVERIMPSAEAVVVTTIGVETIDVTTIFDEVKRYLPGDRWIEGMAVVR